MRRTASDRRIGARTPWNIAQEIALQASRIGKPSAGGKSSPQLTHDALLQELIDLCGEEEAQRLVGQAKAARS